METHLNPIPDIEIFKKLAALKCRQLAVMDSSDGLCDSLFKIAKTSNKSIEIDFSEIPYNKEIEKFPLDFKDLILWGGEDYGLVFCIDEKDYETLKDDLPQIKKIGMVKPFDKDYFVKIDDIKIDEKIFFEKSYNHFG